MYFVWTMVVVISDDRCIRSRLAIVKGILDAFWKSIRGWNCEDTDPRNSPIIVRLNVVLQYGDVLIHLLLLVQTLTW